jgi:hypothetical protein
MGGGPGSTVSLLELLELITELEGKAPDVGSAPGASATSAGTSPTPAASPRPAAGLRRSGWPRGWPASTSGCGAAGTASPSRGRSDRRGPRRRGHRPVSAGEVHLARRDPLPGEVRVALEGCGVCGSNLPVWEGREWFTYPLQPGAPGHEGWGEVAAVGDGVPLATGSGWRSRRRGPSPPRSPCRRRGRAPAASLAGRDFPRGGGRRPPGTWPAAVGSPPTRRWRWSASASSARGGRAGRCGGGTGAGRVAQAALARRGSCHGGGGGGAPRRPVAGGPHGGRAEPTGPCATSWSRPWAPRGRSTSPAT